MRCIARKREREREKEREREREEQLIAWKIRRGRIA